MKIIEPRDLALEQWRPGVETRMVVSAQGGAAALCIFEQWIAPGHGTPTHWHPGRGGARRCARARPRCGWTRSAAIVSAGQSLVVPARRRHGFRNSGTTTLHIHAVLASAVFEQMPDGASEMVRRWVG